MNRSFIFNKKNALLLKKYIDPEDTITIICTLYKETSKSNVFYRTMVMLGYELILGHVFFRAINLVTIEYQSSTRRVGELE